jgi:hypothetical protein
MRNTAVGLALVASAISISLCSPAHAEPASGPCGQLGAIGPYAAGDGYIRCTEGGWITVNRPACVDFPGLFDCAGDPIRVGPLFTIPGEGTFRANIDILPGTYRTSGPSVVGSSCSWVLRRQVGSTSMTSQRPMTVIVAPTDLAFATSGCQPWTPLY